ncbi:unnamed protein product, partial [Ixodes hexagonus]
GPVEVVAVTLYDSFDGQQQQQAQPPGARPDQGPASGSGSSPASAKSAAGPAGSGGSAPTTPQGSAGHRANNGCAPGIVPAEPKQTEGPGDMPLKELKEPKDCE